MIFDTSELPESKYAFSGKCLCVCMCVCVYVCYKFVYSITRNWTEIQVYLWQVHEVYFEVVQVQLYS